MKSNAVRRGRSLKQFLTEAMSEKLDSEEGRAVSRPWMRHFGVLKERMEAEREIDEVIAQEFEKVDPAQWR